LCNQFCRTPAQQKKDVRAAGPNRRAAGPPRPAQQAVLKVVWPKPL
jgi:hypothetical protein